MCVCACVRACACAFIAWISVYRYILNRLTVLTFLALLKWKGSNHIQSARWQHVSRLKASAFYEESVVDKFKSNLLLMIIWLNIINYNS